jgi:hypothetical protein
MMNILTGGLDVNEWENVFIGRKVSMSSVCSRRKKMPFSRAIRARWSGSIWRRREGEIEKAWANFRCHPRSSMVRTDYEYNGPTSDVRPDC